MKPYYQDGYVTIYNCDYREMKLEADVVFLDPPFYLDNLREFKAGVMFIFCGSANSPQYVLQQPERKMQIISIARTIVNTSHWFVDQILVVGDVSEFGWLPVYAISPKGERFHEWERPVNLLLSLIQRTSGIILDPFLGGGTTAVAAKLLGRTCIGCDIDKKCCKTAADRCREIIYPNPYELIK